MLSYMSATELNSASTPGLIIRVLIVDDSAFVRKVVREMLCSSPFIEVIGVANDGEEALRKVEEMKPDLVTCDLTMRGMGGVDFVRNQMRRRPLPILVLSASAADAVEVLEAMSAGAVDFIKKPSALASDDLLRVREELVQKVKAAARAPVQNLLPPATAATQPLARKSGPAANYDAVVLGISTGGPQALRFLIPQLAADFPVPLLVVLHMPVGYTALFAEKLNELSSLEVVEAYEGLELRPAQAVIALAGRHLTLERVGPDQVVARLKSQPLDKPHRPSVDVLFRSAAEVYRHRVMGVIMTGMGNDGEEGAACIKARGGAVLTEAEESCVIYGMPRSVDEAGLSDASIPLTRMAEEIVKRL